MMIIIIIIIIIIIPVLCCAVLYCAVRAGLYTLAIKHMVNLVYALVQGVGVTLPCVQLFRRFCFLEVSDPSKNMTREILDLILVRCY